MLILPWIVFPVNIPLRAEGSKAFGLLHGLLRTGAGGMGVGAWAAGWGTICDDY